VPNPEPTDQSETMKSGVDVAAKPKLFVHMGTHRTATTSIQAFMFSNRQALLDSGVLYPFGVRRHNAEIRKIVAGTMTWAEFSAQIEAQVAAARNVHTVVISDEDISFIQNVGKFAALKEAFDLHFVLFMRRQDLWLESWYMQNIKWQFNKKYRNLTFEDFYAHRGDFFWINYAKVVERLEKFLEPAKIHLQVFEPNQLVKGPVRSFCDVIDLSENPAFEDVPHRNSSMSPLMTEFVRHLPLHKAKAQFRGFLERACARVDQEMSKSKASALYIPHAERVQLMKEHDRGNNWLAQKYFGRAELFLEDLPAASQTLANRELPSSVEELLEKFVGPMIGQMIDERNRSEKAKAANAAELLRKDAVAE
jgi:hypothetical protein